MSLNNEVPIPQEIRLNQASRTLDLVYSESESYTLSHEFLRVFTPSAEARGHGPGQEVLQVGKQEVAIERIEPVGHYALKPIFSDGHDSGLYTWETLYNLSVHADELWAEYLRLLEERGLSRAPLASSLPKAASGCSSQGCRH